MPMPGNAAECRLITAQRYDAQRESIRYLHFRSLSSDFFLRSKNLPRTRQIVNSLIYIVSKTKIDTFAVLLMDVLSLLTSTGNSAKVGTIASSYKIEDGDNVYAVNRQLVGTVENYYPQYNGPLWP